jgi:hypothetical protein
MARTKTRGAQGIRVADSDLADGTAEYLRGDSSVQAVSRIIQESAKKRADYYIQRAKKVDIARELQMLREKVH